MRQAHSSNPSHLRAILTHERDGGNVIAFLKLKLRQRASESVSRGTEFLAQSRVKLSPPCHDGIDCLPFSPLSVVCVGTLRGGFTGNLSTGQGYCTSVSCPVILMMEMSNRTLPPVEQANRQGNRMPPLPTVAPHGIRIPEEVSSPSQAQLVQAVGRMLFSERGAEG